MMRLLAPAMMLSGCASLQPGTAVSTIPISVRSHNRSEVDVYLLCGDRDAAWLGVVGQKETQVFEIAAERARCVSGLNFFLLSRSHNRGYWIGPVHPAASGGAIALTIEKYAGLSTASSTGY
ncbi:MAG TPA: hypothetical protein VKB22_04365 [Gemmatimonadales bacterium]|nr:hypothetical protein [Gemmatimonadales bacterium]